MREIEEEGRKRDESAWEGAVMCWRSVTLAQSYPWCLQKEFGCGTHVDSASLYCWLSQLLTRWTWVGACHCTLLVSLLSLHGLA